MTEPTASPNRSSAPSRRRVLVAVAVPLMLLGAACGDDDGATVRDLGAEDGGSASGSGSGSASGSGSGSASASAPAAGSASGSAPASGGEDAGAAADGGYEYATDVSAHRLVVADVCAVKELREATPIDWEAIRAVYVDGGASVNADGSVRTLQGFATATDRLHGVDTFEGSPTPLDDWVLAAIDGSGVFDGVDDAVRAQAVEKGIQNRIMIAWTIHELNSALAKAADGDFDPDDGAVHNWDEAWAFYHGAEPGCAPFATATSRAGNFGTVGADGEAALANEAILAAMIEGRDALLAEHAAGAQRAADDIVRNVVITYSQATIRYATLVEADVEAGDDAAGAEHRMEGLAFWKVLAPLVADLGADVSTIDAVYDLDAALGANGGGDEVRAALQPAWDALGITADDVGTLQ